LQKMKWSFALVILFLLCAAGASVAADVKMVELTVPGCI
jgi:hypothetical protein